MSVSFVLEVAVGAVDVLVTAPLASSSLTDLLCKKFPRQHPLLVVEHIDYANLLIQSSFKKAEMVNLGSMSKEEAIDSLAKGFNEFPKSAIEKAFEFALSRDDQ
jgi:hypothetical protein